MNDQETLNVRRHWNDYRIAKVRLADFQSPHWDTMSGGVHAASPRPMVYGYIWCDQLLEGELGHSCTHGPAPHRIKVVVVKKDNSAAINRIVRDAADADRARKRAAAP